MMRIGVTGHMYITPETAELVRAELDRILAEEDPAELVGVSCIARGADTVFAQAVLAAGGRLEVIIPSRNYRRDKVKPDHAPLFNELIGRAAGVRTMDHDDAGRAAYEEANAALLDGADRLVAVWDGESGQAGGTASAVELARAAGVPVTVVWPAGSHRG